MRSNEEFKQLVNDKYEKLNKNRRNFRRRLMTVGSSLIVTVIALNVFIGNGLYKKIFSGASDYASSESEISSAESQIDHDGNDYLSEEGGNDTLQSEAEDFEESKGNVSEEIFAEEGVDASNGPDLTVSEDEYDSDTSKNEIFDADEDFIFRPDGIMNIYSTVDLMHELYGVIYEDLCGPEDEENLSFPEVSEGESGAEETPLEPDVDLSQTQNGLTDFSFSIFRESYEYGKNNCVSPASAFYVLGMAANGAHGNTLQEMIDTLCGTDIYSLNAFMKHYKELYTNDLYQTASINGAMWFDSDVSIDKGFLNTNKEYYKMNAYKTVMNDGTALESINEWINRKTYGLIPRMLDNLNPGTDIVMASTVYFESSWNNKFSLLEGTQNFTSSDGKIKQVEMMIGSADKYLENGHCKGFIKDYGEKGKFKFIALLPNENISLKMLLGSLNSQEYRKLLSNASYIDTNVTMPLFECTARLELTDTLKKMGIKDAFDAQNANFYRLTDSNLSLSNVYQDVTISVHEKGTLAASATIITTPGATPPSETKELIFDKPFLYMIIDNETKLPMFIGTVEDFE
ncbi:MAG: hypothetical protein IJY88_05805 [Clostridia bacterium]|nr:hypothetical protein [Clostridia bacterium]